MTIKTCYYDPERLIYSRLSNKDICQAVPYLLEFDYGRNETTVICRKDDIAYIERSIADLV